MFLRNSSGSELFNYHCSEVLSAEWGKGSHSSSTSTLSKSKRDERESARRQDAMGELARARASGWGHRCAASAAAALLAWL